MVVIVVVVVVVVVVSASLSVNIASISTFGIDLSHNPSVILSMFGKCIVAKRLIGSGCHLAF